ncbi:MULTISPECIES: hypothetical protein [Bacillus]|uniref:hypothetical protein n=1 Tax=Bacillus TaxID=1386 RepID=UPI0011A9EFB3|nr:MULTISPECIES: hypothetical protein [Bacillus]
MGIALNKMLNNGLSLNNVYARVDSIFGSKLGVDFSVNYYVSREAFLSGKPYLQQEMYKFVPSIAIGSENIFKQAYMHMKTLEEFKNALDVFEDGQK